MKSKRFFKTDYKIISIMGFFVIFLVLAGSIFFLAKNNFFQKSHPNLITLAKKIVQDCKDVKYRPGCYEKEIPKLMYVPQSLTMQQSFEITAIVQKIDPEYGYCHVTGHHLSQQEVRKDPNKWKEVITKCPVAGCANGCIHGVFMEKFNIETFNEQEMNSLAKDIKTVCEKNDLWNPTNSETSGCFHALGHAAMYLTNADVNRSIKFCHNVGSRDNSPNYYFNCYQGLYMQIFQPLEKEDEQLVSKIKPKTQQEAVKFCSKFQGFARIACLNQMWPLFFKKFQQPEKLGAYCQYFEPQYKQYCYSTVINILTSNLKLDVDFMLNYCSKLKTPSPGECLGQSAARMFEIDLRNESKSISLCSKGESVDPEGKCFQKLLQMGNSVFRNPESEKPVFCHHLPQIWQEKCLKS